MAKTISYVLGVILVLVGLIGFVNDPVLGIFEVDLMHNLVLIVLGLVLLVAAWQNMASMGAKIVGIATAIVAVLGYIPPMTNVLGFIETNLASSVLQTIVALILLYAGFMAKGGGGAGTPPSSAPPTGPSGTGGQETAGPTTTI